MIAAQGKSTSLAGQMFLSVVVKKSAKHIFPFSDMGNYFPHYSSFIDCISIAGSCAIWSLETSTRARMGSTQPNYRLSIRRPACGRYNTIKK